jgi:hypothetical protein
MRKLTIFSILIAIASLFASCKKEFDLNLNGQNKNLLVVEGMITDQNEPQFIKLSRTVSYLNQVKPQAVDNANVSVTVDGTAIPFIQKEPGKYYAPDGFVGQIGKTYNLSIAVDGNTYTASSKMNPAQEMEAASTRTHEFNADYFEIRLTFTDNPDKGDFILFKYARNGQMVDTLKKWSLYTDKLTNGQHFDNILVIGDVEGSVGDQITVYSYSISEEYKNFVDAARSATMEPMPFFPPPGAAITGNISNGAVGFFQASAVRKISTALRK